MAVLLSEMISRLRTEPTGAVRSGSGSEPTFAPRLPTTTGRPLVAGDRTSGER
ncbi:MAG: hypothetical protein AB7J32_04555 [Pseudonocardia sp.]